MVGGEGITELVRLNMEVFDELELEPVEFIDRGETIVVVLRMRVRGRSSGVPLESETVHAWEFKEGGASRCGSTPTASGRWRRWTPRAECVWSHSAWEWEVKVDRARHLTMLNLMA